ncbi:hypothetical protein [Brevundimonas sp. R86498]|uniref:hypothetical protein n=1 Tax=Brevundimonas sp. R86498 TaxID=3093845 RepID=UPI0037C89469
MTVIVEDTQIRIEGTARVEDSERIAGALQTGEPRPVDLSACTDLHAAVLQALLVFRPPVIGLEANPELGAWLLPLLEAGPAVEINR